MRFPCSKCHTLLEIEESDVVTTCPHCNKQCNVEDLIRASIDLRRLKQDIKANGQQHILKHLKADFNDVPLIRKVWLECFVRTVGQIEREEPIKTITLFNKLMGEGEQNA